eukprot:361809-Chlamydomonas_euryale.AAC.7
MAATSPPQQHTMPVRPPLEPSVSFSAPGGAGRIGSKGVPMASYANPGVRSRLQALLRAGPRVHSGQLTTIRTIGGSHALPAPCLLAMPRGRTACRAWHDRGPLPRPREKVTGHDHTRTTRQAQACLPSLHPHRTFARSMTAARSRAQASRGRSRERASNGGEGGVLARGPTAATRLVS